MFPFTVRSSSTSSTPAIRSVSVHCAEVLHFRAMRHVDVFPPHLTLRFADSGFAMELLLHLHESMETRSRSDSFNFRFSPVNFHHIATQPSFHVHHVLQLNLPPVQRIRLIELLADGKQARGCNPPRVYQHHAEISSCEVFINSSFEDHARIPIHLTASPNCAVCPTLFLNSNLDLGPVR